jgi:hypothetical protein
MHIKFSIRCVKLLHNFSGKKSQRLAEISQILRVYQPQMHLRLKIRERKRGPFIAPPAGTESRRLRPAGRANPRTAIAGAAACAERRDRWRPAANQPGGAGTGVFRRDDHDIQRTQQPSAVAVSKALLLWSHRQHAIQFDALQPFLQQPAPAAGHPRLQGRKMLVYEQCLSIKRETKKLYGLLDPEAEPQGVLRLGVPQSFWFPA